MDSVYIHQKARELYLKDYSAVLDRNGTLPPSRNKSPLWPPWSAVEYEAMEHDTAKYFLYYSAIKWALKDISALVQNEPIKIMIIGPGRGRLIDYAIDCLTEDSMDAIIHVIEANKDCCELLRHKYSDVTMVHVHSSMVLRDYDETVEWIKAEENDKSLQEILQRKDVNLFISELFGSFGDNEFMTEILETAVKIFGATKCVSIPQKFTNYLMPIYSATLENYLIEIESNENIETVFILGLPDDIVCLSESDKIYSNAAISSCKCIEGKICFRLDQQNLLNQKDSKTPHTITGFAGHFTAVLYKNILIDTRPRETRNTFFWESAFFPLNSQCREKLSEKLMRENTEINLTLKRFVNIFSQRNRGYDKALLCDPKTPLFRLHYEYFVSDENSKMMGKVHNKFGRRHSLYL